MFLLAFIAICLLALGLAAFAVATGSKAAVRAAAQVLRPDTGMPEQAQTNHPVSLREARLANDASSTAASAAVSPAIAESDDLETTNIIVSVSVLTNTHGLPPSASPHSMRGLALGVSHDRAEQPLPPRDSGAQGPDRASCAASPRPRVKRGEAGRRSQSAYTPALTC